MRFCDDCFGGVAGVVYQNFLGRDDYVYGVAIGFYIKGAIGRELQKIQAGQVAGGVVEEHVLAARITRVDSRGVLRSVPAIYGGIVLHAGIAAGPGGFGQFVEKIFGFVSVDYAAIYDCSGGEIGVAADSYHEVVGYADAVVGVLEEDRAVG